MKLSARFKLVALLALCALMWAGAAWAGDPGTPPGPGDPPVGPPVRPPITLYHHIKVGMNNGVTDFTVPPQFNKLFMHVEHYGFPPQPMGASTGEFTFDFKNAVTIDKNEDSGGKYPYPAGSYTFNSISTSLGL